MTQAEPIQRVDKNHEDIETKSRSSRSVKKQIPTNWVQDWSEYNFAGLPFDRLNEIVHIGKQYLEDLLKPVTPACQCIAFRAANWSVNPSRNVVRALLNNGIRIETSVFKHGRREGIVSFDYSDAPSELVPWLVDEGNMCRRNDVGKLMEVPIYCELRWIGAFLTPNRVHAC